MSDETASEGVTPPTRDGAERDSWRQLAEDWHAHAWRMARHGAGHTNELDRLTTRRDALLASVDPRPPVFHVRPEWVHRTKPVPVSTLGTTGAFSLTTSALVCEWRWVAIAANGNKLYGSTESYEHKQHAIEQATEVASALGAEVRIEGEDD